MHKLLCCLNVYRLPAKIHTVGLWILLMLMLQRIASLGEEEQDEIATVLSPLLENNRQPTQHMLEFFTAVRHFLTDLLPVP